MSAIPDLAECLPSFLKRTKDPAPMTPQTQTEATPKARKARRDCLNIVLKVSVPFTDRASLDAAYEAADDAKAPSSWPEGAVIVATATMGKM